MKRSLRIGFSFGLTSGIITTLGLMVGLHASTESKFVVIGGILTIAIADAFAESMGVHAATECENKITTREVWESTFFTFICKFCFTSMFIIPVLLFSLQIAIILSILLGFYLLFVLSMYIARERGCEVWKMVLEHLSISSAVILLAHFAGQLIAITFGNGF
jgi:VIT1/CCC1 family predicted Fe2+/Mn2+ transporter